MNKSFKQACASAALALCAATALPVYAQKFTLATAADSFQHSLQDIAMDGGFFKQEGLTVNPVYFDSGTRQSAAIMSDTTAVGPVGLIHNIKATSAGGRMVAISRAFDVIDVYMIMSNDALAKTGITPNMPLDEKVKRMRGLRVGITGPGSVVDTTVRAIFKSRGIDPDKEMKLLPLGSPTNMMAAMEKNATDVFAYPAPWPTIAAGKGMGKVVIDPFVDQIAEVKGVPYNVIAASRDMVEKEPETVEKIVRALTRAMKYAKENPEGAKQIMRKRFPDIDEAVFNSLWTSYAKAIPQDPVITQQQFDLTQKWLNITAQPAYALTYEQVVYSKGAVAASKSLLGK